MNEADWSQLELTANNPKSRVKELERSCSRIMREQVEMSAAALYSTIPLLPELEQSLSSLSAGGELGMEGLRRVMLSSEALMDDSVCLPPLPESSVDCETDVLQLSDSSDLCKLSQMTLHPATDPSLHDRSLDDSYHGDEVMMYTELTNHYREFSPGSTGDSNLEQELSDCGSNSDSGLESSGSGVRWTTIAECPVVAISIDNDVPLPPVGELLCHRPGDDFLGLSNRRPPPLSLIKTEILDSEDDCCLSPHDLHPDPFHHHHHHQCHNISSESHHDYIMDENNNDVKTASSPRKASQVKSAPLHSGEKAQRKKPGRKKGQVSKVLHLWEFIRDLLNDPKTSPHLITWENEEEGVFRVMQSSEVARLWGEKKKNKRTMTYEKLSRSLRYSRKEGYFDSLPKDRGYPKKLCFKFGPKSHGWKCSTR